MKKQLYILSILALSVHGNAQRQIFVNGPDVTVSTQAGTLQPISVAGSNYTNDYLSPTNLINISVTIPGSILFSQGSRVYVSQSPINWPQSLQLFVRRTGDGSACGGCTIAENSTNDFYLVTNNASSFMLPRTNVFILGGGGTYSNIPVQIKISGISITLPAATYSTNITFTVTAP
jgi:hypothetical protein